MNEITGKLLAALLGALLCWLIAKFYNRSRLYCAPSRLYEYSHLVDGSSTVQLVIANKGRKTEEAVEVQLSMDYEYHLLAASQNGIETGQDKLIKLPALLPKSEISLIVVAEGKPRFSKEGIRSIRSKTARGLVGASLAEAEAASPGAIPLVVLFLILVGIFGYGVGKTVGEDIWDWARASQLEKNAQPFSQGCVTSLSNAPNEPKDDELGKKALQAFALKAVTVDQVATMGDMLHVDVSIENLVEGPIEYSLRLQSHASDSTTDRTHRSEDYIYDIVILGDGEKRSYKLSEYFPADRGPKRFWLATRVEMFGYWVEVKQSYFFGADSSMTCPAPTDE